MQTAVDCSGSNNSSNNSNFIPIATINSATILEGSSADLRSSAAVTTTESPAPQHVLRQRLQVGHPQPRTTNPSAHKNATALLIDAAEYLGSNVEQMSITPSPSPQASPSKTRAAASPSPSVATAATAVIATSSSVLQVNAGAHPTSSSSSSASNSNSNSNSTTSSVIATPILTRNGNAPHVQDIACDGGDRRSVERNEMLATKTLSLPSQSMLLPTFASLDDPYALMELSTPLTPSWPSANSSKTSSPSPATTTTTSCSATPACTTPAVSSTLIKPTSMEPQLLQWKDMPKYLQFNPYVLHGYRPLQTFTGCLFSLFYWHNETINILTHAIPILYILAIVPGLMPWEQEYRFLSFCHVFGSVAPWCGSFVYHLFMNIEMGENVYYRLLKLDMVGIWVSQSFGALPLVTATAFCFSSKWKWCIIISYCLLSLWGLYKALSAGSPWQRRLCFTLPFIMRSILTFLRTLGVVGGNRVALSHVYLQDVVSILGGAIGAMRIPEKWFPGLVDYYLNSHNIMHVLVVVAVYSMHKATVKDIEWMSATSCAATLTNATGEAIAIETNLGANIEL